MEQKLNALKVLGKNPSFLPTICCGSVENCGSFAPSDIPELNYAHIALRFETVRTEVPATPTTEKQIQLDLAPKLYCKRTHPNELGLPSEADLNWHVEEAGLALSLSQLETTLTERTKIIRDNPKLAKEAAKSFDEGVKRIKNLIFPKTGKTKKK